MEEQATREATYMAALQAQVAVEGAMHAPVVYEHHSFEHTDVALQFAVAQSFGAVVLAALTIATLSMLQQRQHVAWKYFPSSSR